MAACTVLAAQSGPTGEVWRFDRLDRIGGHPVTVLGHPRVIDTPAGKAVEFNGIDDALLVDVHPLAGAQTFTWEVIFRPDPGGAAEQRFFHLQERGTENRLLLEIRVIGSQWCFDSFALSGAGRQTLLNREKLHPLGVWHHVAAVYDGREFRQYVDGVLEGAAEMKWTPQGEGQSSVGTRINRRDYFKGAIRRARMTPRALSPDEFWKGGAGGLAAGSKTVTATPAR